MKKPEDHHPGQWQPQEHHPLFALYGSLRTGMENRFRIEGATETLAITEIAGFTMYVRADYPYVVASGNPNDRIVIELVRITDPAVIRRMCAFEASEGYQPALVQVGEFEAWLFLFSNPGADPVVHGGDWVRHLKP